jgi:hypothetical protein
MTEGDILQRDSGRVDEESAAEGPDTEDEDHHSSRS